MARLVSFIVLFGAMAYASALPPTNISVETSSQAQISPIATILSQRLVDIFSQKLTSLARYFQLKIRVVRFLASLYTNENLLLLRDLIGQGQRFANFILRFIPKSTNDPGFEWVLIISEMFRTSNAAEELLGTFLGSQSEPLGELSVENQTDSPIFYNAAVGNGHPDLTEVNSKEFAGVKRENREANEDDLGVTDDRIMALDKLIRAKRK